MITPAEEQPNIANDLGLNTRLVFKREDLHPYGSHKGRSIPVMIEKYAEAGTSNFAISSSGNAALAAAHFVREYNTKFPEQPVTLTIYIGEKVAENKLRRLQEFENNEIKVEQVERPKQTVHKLNKAGEAKALRQSNDDTALAGYESLAEELKELNPGAVFIPTSSGTTAEALGKFLPNVQIHIVQTGFCHPIAETFDTNFNKSDSSIASAIVDIVGKRKESVVKVVKKSGGSGWVVSDSEIREAIDLVKEHTDITLSPNSALSIAGLKKSLDLDKSYQDAVVCLITGQ